MSTITTIWSFLSASRSVGAPTRNSRAIALIEGSRRLTYAEVDQLVTETAFTLFNLYGVRPGDRVIVSLDSSIELVVAMLALFSMGAVYIPVTPDTPLARMRLILQQCDACYLIHAAGHACIADLRESSAAECIAMESLDKHVLATTRHQALRPPQAADVAYVIFTSGSTGLPKGVVIPHGALTRSVLDEEELVDRVPELAREDDAAVDAGDLPGEARPTFPLSLDWYEERYNYRPKTSEVLSLSIGQGPNAQTPLRIADTTATVENPEAVPPPPEETPPAEPVTPGPTKPNAPEQTSPEHVPENASGFLLSTLETKNLSMLYIDPVSCVGCGACVTACPSGVKYDALIEQMRPEVERRTTRALSDRAFRRFCFEAFTHPGRLRAAVRHVVRAVVDGPTAHAGPPPAVPPDG